MQQPPPSSETTTINQTNSGVDTSLTAEKQLSIFSFHAPAGDPMAPPNHWNDMYFPSAAEFFGPIADINKLKNMAWAGVNISERLFWSMGNEFSIPCLSFQQQQQRDVNPTMNNTVTIRFPRQDTFLSTAFTAFSEYTDYVALYSSRPAKFAARKNAMLYGIANKDPKWRLPPLLPFANLCFFYNRNQDFAIGERLFTVITLERYEAMLEEGFFKNGVRQVLIDKEAICRVLGISTHTDDIARYSALVASLYLGSEEMALDDVVLVDVSAEAGYNILSPAGNTITQGDCERAYQYLSATLSIEDYLMGIYLYNPFQHFVSYTHRQDDLLGPPAIRHTIKVPNYNFVDHLLVHNSTQQAVVPPRMNFVAYNCRIIQLFAIQVVKRFIERSIVYIDGARSRTRDWNLNPLQQMQITTSLNLVDMDYIPCEIVQFFKGSHPSFQRLYAPKVAFRSTAIQTDDLPLHTYSRTNGTTTCIYSLGAVTKKATAMNVASRFTTADVMFKNNSLGVQTGNSMRNRIARCLPYAWTDHLEGYSDGYSIGPSLMEQIVDFNGSEITTAGPGKRTASDSFLDM